MFRKLRKKQGKPLKNPLMLGGRSERKVLKWEKMWGRRFESWKKSL